LEGCERKRQGANLRKNTRVSLATTNLGKMWGVKDCAKKNWIGGDFKKHRKQLIRCLKGGEHLKKNSDRRLQAEYDRLGQQTKTIKRSEPDRTVGGGGKMPYEAKATVVAEIGKK